MLWLGKEHWLAETGVRGRGASLRLLWEPSALRYSRKADFFWPKFSSLLLLKCKIGKWSRERKSGELETCSDSSLEAPCLLMRHETPCGFCNAELSNGLSWTACLPAESEVATVS